MLMMDSLLYYFYLSAYKVFLGNLDTDGMDNAMPLSIIRNKHLRIGLQDFIAPFCTYVRAWHSIKQAYTDDLSDSELLILKSKIQASIFGKIHPESESVITLKRNCIQEFTYETKKTKIQAKWTDS
jgi:hypothetical protein